MRHSNLIGVDVSDSSIKVLQLDSSNAVVSYGTEIIPEGIIENGHILDKEIFSQKLIEILKRTKPKKLFSNNSVLRAVLSLPEAKLYTHHIVVPQTVKKAELETYIKQEAQKIIPHIIDDMYWDYHAVEKAGTRTVTFVGVSKPDLDNYVEAFSHANVKPAYVGGELSSLARALLPEQHVGEGYIILDIGSSTTTIGIFGEDTVAHASIIVPRGGDLFTNTLAQELEISAEKAEEMKREFGIDPAHKKKKMHGILLKCLSPVIEKVKESQSYFEKKSGATITHLIVAGGSGLMPGLCEYIAEQTGIATTLADPLPKIANHAVFGADTPGILFANVIGLASRATHEKLSTINLLTQYRYEDNSMEKELLSIDDIRSVSDFNYVVYGYTRKIKDAFAPFKKVGAVASRLNFSVVFSFCFLIATLCFLVWVITKYM